MLKLSPSFDFVRFRYFAENLTGKFLFSQKFLKIFSRKRKILKLYFLSFFCEKLMKTFREIFAQIRKRKFRFNLTQH
jgi:hypothetical protein